MRIVVALGGNALLERGEAPDSSIQEAHIARAAEALAPLIRNHDVIITHGNGPQVGVLALESAADTALSHPSPFDALVAETQGLIGNWLLSAIERTIPGHDAVCLLTRTVVDTLDPAFTNPTKFVGPIYTKEVADKLAAERGWTVKADGTSWRRVVASPEPQDIIELDDIKALVNRGATVICAGGGGVPVVVGSDGLLSGVEAVIDKDMTAALLAEELDADVLLLLTDVANVQIDYGTPQARAIGQISVDELRALEFPAGSMGPKVQAACQFVERTGGVAAIGRLTDASSLLVGDVGTVVTSISSNREAGGGRPLSAAQG
jgi:carbamate kinase